MKSVLATGMVTLLTGAEVAICDMSYGGSSPLPWQITMQEIASLELRYDC